MNESLEENWESRIKTAASELVYPPTPDIARQVRRSLEGTRQPRVPYTNRIALGIAILVILLLAIISLVPPVRAAVVDFLNIGAVRIFLVEPTPTATSTPATSTPIPAETKHTSLPSATLRPTSIYLASLLDLQGETTIEQALKQMPFTPSLPTYPPDLGNPDRIFIQDQDGQVLILVWTDPQHPETVRLSLHEIASGSWGVTKLEPLVLDQLKVNGRTAYWTEGPYMVILTNGEVDMRRLVDGHVLIWEQFGITYRLESDLTMEEAVKIAESLAPVSP